MRGVDDAWGDGSVTPGETAAGRTADPRSAPASSVPAGWYPDPGSPSWIRYWDGAAWTSATAAPVPPPPPQPPAPASAPGSGNGWLILFRVLTAVGILFIAYVLVIAWQASVVLSGSGDVRVNFPIEGIIATVVLAILASRQGNQRYRLIGILLSIAQVIAVVAGFVLVLGHSP